MNKFEYLANQFSIGLGDNFNINYYENNPPKWSDIILDNMIHAVMLVNGGNSVRAGGSLIDTKQLSISFAIPITLDVFSSAIQTIDDYFNALIGTTYSYDGSSITMASYYRSDASKVLVNGIDYAIVTAYVTSLFYDNAILSYESEIKLDGVVLEGVLNVVYSNQHSVDGGVFGLKDPEQKNYLNGIVISFTIDIVLRKGDDLHLDLLKNVDSDKSYIIEYNNGIITREYEVMVLKLDEIIQTGDIIKAQIVLGRGD